MADTVQRHTTVSGFDENEEWHSVTLAPGDELPEWAPESVRSNKLLFEPLTEDKPFLEDEETGTVIKESGTVPADHTSPTTNAGYETSAEATEEARAAAKAESGAAAGGGYEAMNKDQLSALLEERGLAKSGTRQELIERLQQSDAGNG